MLFRKQIEKSCSYCARAVKVDDETMVCTKRGPVPADDACRAFRYDPLKRVPDAYDPDLPHLSDLDYSL